MTRRRRAAGGRLRRDGVRGPAGRRLLERLEAVMLAVAFAEVGEPDPERRMGEESAPREPGGGGRAQGAGR